MTQASSEKEKIGLAKFLKNIYKTEFNETYTKKIIGINPKIFFSILSVLLISIIDIAYFILFQLEYKWLILISVLLGVYFFYTLLKITNSYFLLFFISKIKISNTKLKQFFNSLNSIYFFVLISGFLILLFNFIYNYIIFGSVKLDIDFFYKNIYIISSLSLLLILKNYKLFFKLKYITFLNYSIFLVFSILLDKYIFSPSFNYIFALVGNSLFIFFGLVKLYIRESNDSKNKSFLVNSIKKSFKKALKDFKDKNDDNYTYQNLYNQYIENIKNSPKANSIELLFDKPIESFYDENAEKDILEHNKITEKLFGIIVSLDLKNYNNSYTIGLVGERGIGKSGIINMLNNDWMAGRNDMIFYEFSPWSYKKEDLINKFFTDLGNFLDLPNFNRIIKAYLKIIGSIDNLKGVSLITDLINIFFPEKTLDEIKKEINNKLNNYNKKIIISIDDLDRCEPDEIITMLNLVKNLGNFKNIIYVVSYDKENVLNVIKEKKFGDNYLDKIINTEVYVSNPNIDDLGNYYYNGSSKILNILFNKHYNSENQSINNDIKFIKLFTNEESINVNQFIFTSNYKSFNLNNMLQYENLRFLKKYLNYLNLILTFIYDSLDKKQRMISFIEKYNYFDILNCLIYIKMKDYNLYNYVILNRKQIYSNLTSNTNYDIDIKYLKASNILIKDKFFSICGFKIENDEILKSTIFDFHDITYILENII